MVLRSAFGFLAACLLAVSCATTPTIVPTEAALALSADMGRDDAIARLAAETFLPIDKAACVIDAVFLNAGVYNPKSAEALAVVDQAGLVAGCTEVDEDFVMPERDENAPEVEIQELEVETGAIATLAPFTLTADTMPALNPGGLATGQVTLGGKTIDYVTITPLGFDVGDSAPVFFALPPGGQDLEITRNVARGVYMSQALSRGWVVVSPAAPGGLWADDDNTAVVPEFVSWINAWVAIEGGRPHLGGMSNGGISAFHIAAQDPSLFRSLLAYPGFPNTQSDQDALASLVGLPVRLWVGGDDTQWVTSMETTAEVLRTVGADVELTIFPGEPHVIPSIANGFFIFDELSVLS